MPYLDSLEQAKEFGTKARGMMEKHGVPLSPGNYTVWYEYVAGRNQDLVRALDVLMSNGVEFNQERNLEIYDQFFGGAEGGVDFKATFGRLSTLMERLSGQVGEGAADQTAYCDKLFGISKDLVEQSGDPADLNKLVHGLLSETHAVMAKSKAMADKLAESSSEIVALRTNLERVQQEAITDSLTGIANRKHFDSSLRHEAAVATESGVPLSLIMCDIDHFKKYNDSFGHRIGDEVLKVAARVIKENVKGRDVPARYGGEEFCVILPNTKLGDAVHLADHIRSALASRALTNKKTGASYGTITLSLGAAALRFGEPLEQLIQRADEALYRAKRDGRNRVEQETEEEPVSLSA